MAPARVCLVDDEPHVLQGLRRGLYNSLRPEWETTFFEDPQTALEYCTTANPAVVVVDIKMPVMSGLELMKRIREKGGSPKFIVLSGNSDLGTATEAINNYDVFRFYTKPCPIKTLIEGISTALKEAEEADLGAAALQMIPTGVLMVDANNQILFMNNEALKVIRARDGLFLSVSGAIRSSETGDHHTLHKMISAAVKSGQSTMMSVPRKNAEPLSIAICPIPSSLDPSERKAALFFTAPEARPVPSPLDLGTFLGLSLAESRLAHFLARGLSMDEASLACGVTVSTARTYLKRIFEKTGKTRQAELVRLIMTLPVLAKEA